MEKATGDLDRLPRMTPVDEPAVLSTACGARRGASLAILRAMIKVLVLGLLGYFVFSILMLGWAVTFGDYPWGRWTVVSDAGKYLSERDPGFRIKDYDAIVRWVGGREGAWEIYFTHKATWQRRCLQWINGGFLYGYSFKEIDCPAAIDGPSG
jgi:hypothetical protein